MTIRVDRYVIPGGMVYVGSDLPALDGRGVDPALIDPRLRLGRRADPTGSGMGYWPSYRGISPECRAGYLEWLAAGRLTPKAYIGYVFLFFYGLERRVLADCAKPGPARADLPLVQAEVRRLLWVYGANNSFRGYATRLLETIDVLTTGQPDQPPVYDGNKWPTPLALRTGLGGFSAAGVPIPAAWALSWAQFHPEIRFSTPARRCPEEFTRLFVIRYEERYGRGMTVRPNKTTVRSEYRAASAGIGMVNMDTGLPDVFGLAAPAKKLATLVAECTEELDPYSRWLGRNPGGRGTLAAATLLPTGLVDPGHGAVAELLRWADSRLGPERQTVVDGADLMRFWNDQDVPRPTRTEATAFSRLLAGQGFGIEPDPRFGGAVPNDGPAVLFRTDPGGSPSVPSTAYTAAATLLHLAVAVAGADDDVSDPEQVQLVGHLRTSLHLTPAEQTRMEAHLRLLLHTGVKLTGLTRRLRTLSAEQREQVALFCVRIAAADGTLATSEMATLTRIYKLLELDPDLLPHDAHVEMTSQSTRVALADPGVGGPVTVRRAGNAPSGYAVPPQPPRPGFHLDETAIAAKLAETEQVSALLGQIFTEDAEPPTVVPDAPTAAPAAGLDHAHSALLRALADRLEWTRARFEDLCADLGLLPDGALDTINDAALEVAGEPVVEGDDPIQINTDAMQEMLT